MLYFKRQNCPSQKDSAAYQFHVSKHTFVIKIPWILLNVLILLNILNWLSLVWSNVEAIY